MRRFVLQENSWIRRIHVVPTVIGVSSRTQVVQSYASLWITGMPLGLGTHFKCPVLLARMPRIFPAHCAPQVSSKSFRDNRSAFEPLQVLLGTMDQQLWKSARQGHT